MADNDQRLIAVIGASGNQGGAVVRALQANGRFKVRALTRNPDAHRDLAEQVVAADLDRPETLKVAFEGAHGVFLVTNFWEQADEVKQATAAVRAAKDAGVKHFVWSTLPDVEAISGGTFNVPHFTGKAKVDRIVESAGFENHTFVIAPFFYQNLVSPLGGPQKQADGSMGWVLPIDPNVRCIHMGDITEIGSIVAGAFALPEVAGHGAYLPLVGDFMSFNEIIDTLNRQGHAFSFKRVPEDVFAAFFPGAAEVAEMFRYFQAHSYLGSDARDQIALANKIAGRQPSTLSMWARANFRVQTA